MTTATGSATPATKGSPALDLIPEGRVPQTAAEFEDAANAVKDAATIRVIAPVGPVRPADSLEARVFRIEEHLRGKVAAHVLTPEEAVAAAEYDDRREKEAVQAERDRVKAEAEAEKQAAAEAAKSAGK